jgi:hypothetical protein
MNQIRTGANSHRSAQHQPSLTTQQMHSDARRDRSSSWSRLQQHSNEHTGWWRRNYLPNERQLAPTAHRAGVQSMYARHLEHLGAWLAALGQLGALNPSPFRSRPTALSCAISPNSLVCGQNRYLARKGFQDGFAER